ncbi:DUF4252 domain-containing protein [Dolichospermum sp. ST_sed3]|nr:DUF4252 domain-containing protein [Dolichospermum sp. ST_sed3]
MKRIILVVAMAASSLGLLAQAKTTNALQKNFDNSLSLYFYKNTLRMLNQAENKDFDEMVKNIDKLKFLMVDKTAKNFGTKEYQKLISDYRAEDYESAMTGRMDGRNFDVFIKDKPQSTVVLVNDSSNLFVLDMVGTIDASKVGTLFSTIDNSTDIGKKIKSFTEHKGKKDEDKDKEKPKEKSEH